MAGYIVPMATTIQVSKALVETLREKKLFDKESYEEVIWDLLEDTQELSDETKRHLREAEEDVKKGRVRTHADIKKELGLDV